MKGLFPPENILPERGEALLFPEFFSPGESDELFIRLREEIPWRQEAIKMFGREVMQPRLTAWFADPNIRYGYSGIRLSAEEWSPLLLAIKSRVEAAAGVRFSGALLNFYRSGSDSMGWHRDDEKELGPNPVIGSVSFGATRRFLVRNVKDKRLVREIPLAHGSLLLMRGEMQHAWEHAVPKTKREPGPRINLTFRVLAPKP